MPHQLLKERAKSVREQIHAQKGTPEAIEALREFRHNKLYQHLGFRSFNAWLQADSPWSQTYTYKASKEKPSPKHQKVIYAKDTAEISKPQPRAIEIHGHEIPTVKTDAIPLAKAEVQHQLKRRVVRDNDCVGQKLNDVLSVVFEDAVIFDDIQARIVATKDKLIEIAGGDAARELARYNRMEIACQHLDALLGIIRRSRPWARCPYCSGRTNGCNACNRRGWLTQDEWKRIPAE